MRALCYGSLVLGFLVLTGALRADDQANAKVVIDKALKAMGSAEKVAKFKAGTWKGKMTHEENGKKGMLVGEGAWQGTDKARLSGEVTEGDRSFHVAFAINGDKGWEKRNDMVRDAPEAVFSLIKEAFYGMRMVHLLPELKDAAFKLSPLGEVKVNDKAAVGLSVAHKDHKDVSVYFDKETSLPVKSEIRATDPQGKEITIEYFYSDFQEADAVKHPMKITIKADGNEFSVEINEIKSKDKVDESEFAKP